MDGCVGSITTFIVEPFAPHQEEFYLCIQSQRLGNDISFSQACACSAMRACSSQGPANGLTVLPRNESKGQPCSSFSQPCIQLNNAPLFDQPHSQSLHIHPKSRDREPETCILYLHWQEAQTWRG